MEIYFVRHGAAVDQKEWKGSDHERPLTDKGTREMARAAQGIATLGIRPDRIIASPYVRARQTADIIAKELGLIDNLATDERLSPGFGIKALAALLEESPKSGSFMLVGHEPDFSAVVGRLIGGGRVECRKGSLARVRLDDPTAGGGILVCLLPPEQLAGLARGNRLPRETE